MGKLLSQNSELKKDGIWNWSIPAWQVQLSNGSWFNCCPNADFCVKVCYARNGTYLFPVVKAKHLSNLEFTINDLVNWGLDMIKEINKIGLHKIKFLRIHDAGDFYSDEYLQAWIDIAMQTPSVIFYAYTKEVSRFKRMVQGSCPKNFKYLFSLGGKEDHLIDLELDRHCDVFPSLEALNNAGYMDQSENDLLAINLPTNKIGIVSNNIKHFKKIQGELTFKSGQEKRKDLRDKQC